MTVVTIRVATLPGDCSMCTSEAVTKLGYGKIGKNSAFAHYTLGRDSQLLLKKVFNLQFPQRWHSP